MTLPPSCHPHAILMPPSCHPHTTLEWHVAPCRSGLTFLIWQVSYYHTLSGTTCHLSNMIDCPPQTPPPPPWGEGGRRGRAPARAPLKKVWGGLRPPACIKLSAIFKIHISSLKVLRCKYETRIPSKKERIRMIEIVLHKLWFLIYIFLQQPEIISM